MTAGNQYTVMSINNGAAAAVVQVRDAFVNLKRQYQWLNQLGTSGIQAAPVGPPSEWDGQPPVAITSGDAGTILAALTDLAGLEQFFSGQAVTLGFGAAKVTGPYDFMTFGRLLTNGL